MNCDHFQRGQGERVDRENERKTLFSGQRARKNWHILIILLSSSYSRLKEKFPHTHSRSPHIHIQAKEFFIDLQGKILSIEFSCRFSPFPFLALAFFQFETVTYHFFLTISLKLIQKFSFSSYFRGCDTRESFGSDPLFLVDGKTFFNDERGKIHFEEGELCERNEKKAPNVIFSTFSSIFITFSCFSLLFQLSLTISQRNSLTFQPFHFTLKFLFF